MRTTSENDAEALASLRAANRLLAQHSLTWDSVFARTVTVVNEIIDNTKSDSDEDALFEKALEGTTGKFRDVLLSIYEQYHSGHRLSEKQWQVIRNAASR